MSALQFPLNKILAQIQTNPINWSLLTILGIMVYNLFTSEESKNYQTQTRPSGPPKSVEFKEYTAEELQPFSGEDSTPVYMGVLGEVFDVSSGRNFYGPGGPYENFAGRDASRGLAKHSFDIDMLTPVHLPWDDLKDLNKGEWEAVLDWQVHFRNKYILVGKLKDYPEIQPLR